MVMGRYRSTYSIRGVLMNFNLTILNQYFRFIHIMSSTSPRDTKGDTMGRHDYAVLRGRVPTEDDGAWWFKHILSSLPLHQIRHCLS